MNDPRTTPKTGSLPSRPERRVAALVTQYIHELSDRHARSRNGNRPRDAAARGTGGGPEPATEPQGG